MEDLCDISSGIESNDSTGEEDAAVKINQLMLKIEKLEEEKLEFGHQRAKMKELFLQKEEELVCQMEDFKKLENEFNETKSQMAVTALQMEAEVAEEKRKCQEQVSSLQQIVEETLEESSNARKRFDAELMQLKQAKEKLEGEVHELRFSDKETSTKLGTPAVMLTQYTKTLARKVVSQLGADTSSSSVDNLEDSMRKAQEDAKVLRSLVIPLEEEIQALKEKLRDADQVIRLYESNKGEAAKYHEEDKNVDDKNYFKENGEFADVNSADTVSETERSPNSPKSIMNVSTKSMSSLNELQISSLTKQTSDPHSPSKEGSTDFDKKSICHLCCNYEEQLVQEQKRTKEIEKQLTAMEKTAELYKEDLDKEAKFRKEMEEKWNVKKEEHKQQVSDLTSKMEECEKLLSMLRQNYSDMRRKVSTDLEKLTEQREHIQKELDKLQEENDDLMGKHSKHSQQLQNEMINLPNNVEELQELLLKSYQELITAKVAKEKKEESEATLKCEVQLLNIEQKEKLKIEQSLNLEMKQLKDKLVWMEEQLERILSAKKTLEKECCDMEGQISKLKEQLVESQKNAKENEEVVNDLKGSLSSLKQELDTSETVQKDFVKLSQTLQVQLESIRQSNLEVRWQHEEDVEVCPNCENSIRFNKKKLHCCHCGKIFCSSCLSHTVSSGPNKRPSKVCNLCYVLLVPESAPYFSPNVPNTPD